jgi:hypothetical protein
MNHLSKAKIILYLSAIFVAGGVTGAVWHQATATHGSKDKSPAPSPKRICDWLRERLQTEFQLNDEQVKTLEPLLEKRRRGMEEIRNKTIEEFEALKKNSNHEIAEALNLNPDQRAKLDRIDKGRRESSAQRNKTRDAPQTHEHDSPR